MHKILTRALGAASLLALSACNQQSAGGGNEASGSASAPAGADSINGTWKADLATADISTKPDQLLVKGGQYSCPGCTPPITLAADGAFHPVTGRPYADSMAVKIDDAQNVTRTARKGGAVTGEVKYSVSGDGKTLNVSFTDSSVPNAKPVTGTYSETRAAPAPAGAHAVSGSWKLDKITNVSDEGLLVTYRLDGDTLHMSSPAGTSFDAKLDGTDTPIKGDTAGTTASVKKLSDTSFVETDKRGGKVVGISTTTVDSASTAHVVSENKLDGSTTKYVMNKS